VSFYWEDVIRKLERLQSLKAYDFHISFVFLESDSSSIMGRKKPDNVLPTNAEIYD
jgi:hypothetical protein